VEGAVIGQRQEIEIPQKPVEVIEHQRVQKSCPQCGCQNEGPWPEHIRGNIQYGRRFKAVCVYLLSQQLLPYDRTGELLGVLFGYHPGGGTLNQAQQQAYEGLEPVEVAIKEAVRASPQAHSDETGMRVAGKTQWLHVCSTQTHTYYYWSQYRGQQAHQADGLLPEYRGILMHDAYSTYFGLEWQHARCNAHLLRELQALAETAPTLLWPQQVNRLLRTAWAMVKQAKVDGLSELPEPTRKRIKSLFGQIIDTADQRTVRNQRQPGQRGRVAQSPQRNLLDRLMTYTDQYLRFVTDFSIPFDNNLAERDLRMCKLQQKISGCFRTATGADLFCRIRGYISTLRKQGHDLISALFSLFDYSPFFPIPAE
jgi:transposase